MTGLAGRRIALGVSGGIAAYKACTVARRLTELGAAVDVVFTASAEEFVRPLTFETLTGRPVLTSLWTPGSALAHIHEARSAELVLLAPATAHLLARAAQGLADDLLTTILLATDAPVVAAPAMNDRMYAHPDTTRNIERLRERGWVFVGPAVGPLAEGPTDAPGRMSEPEAIVAVAERVLRGAGSKLRGRRIVVTAGPTREEIDPVRVISNRSSGRMGYALAAAAFARGGHVTLISGPSSLDPPYGVELVRVESTDEMSQAVAAVSPTADVLVMAAAPADFRPSRQTEVKTPRSESMSPLALVPTTDILESTREHRHESCITVGFALETSDDVDRAREKLHRKGLRLIVLNRTGEPGAGFETSTNRVTLVDANDAREVPTMSKRDVAEHILDATEALM